MASNYLISVVSAGKCLRHLQEPPSGIFSKIHVVLFIILVHHLWLQIFLSRLIFFNSLHFSGRAYLFKIVSKVAVKIVVEIDKVGEVLIEHSGSGEWHHDLIFPSFLGNLSNLDESSSLIFFHIKMELFVFEHQGARSQILENKHTEFSLDSCQRTYIV